MATAEGPYRTNTIAELNSHASEYNDMINSNSSYYDTTTGLYIRPGAGTIGTQKTIKGISYEDATEQVHYICYYNGQWRHVAKDLYD